MFIQIKNVRINTDHILKYETVEETYTECPNGPRKTSYNIRINYNRDTRYDYLNSHIVFCFDTKEERDKVLKLLDVACDVKKVD